MDLLSDILDTIVLRGQLYFNTCFSPPWAISVPDNGRAIRFHYAVTGQCHIATADGASIVLNPGDLALIPNGAAHAIADDAQREPRALESVLTDSGFTGDGVFTLGGGDLAAATQLVCGHFTFAPGGDHVLLRALPSLLHISADLGRQSAWLRQLLQLMAARIATGVLGSESAVRRISEIIFIEAVQLCRDQLSPLSKLMQAFADPKISRALAAIHARPAESWTVDTLAGEAAMSRSRFADRFQELVGYGPLAYLTEWRMQRARALLTSSDATIQEIAASVGYQSPAAFTRAFGGHFGASPSKFRARSV